MIILSKFLNGAGMKKLLLIAMALGSLVGAPALAADIGVPPPPPPPPPVVLTPWSACYIGGEGGGLWARKEWFDNTDVAFLGESFGSHTASGWLAGIQAGCDFQFSFGFLIGIQADYDWAGAKGSNTNLIFTDFTDQSRVRSVGSATARLGYAWGWFLAYVKGGPAWEHDEYAFIVSGITTSTAGENPRFGWTVGGGGEFLITDWLSVFVEYDYYGFGRRNLLFTDGTSVEIKETKNVVKAGLNFRFGSWGRVVGYR
jgi:outer membrane immunogenic protein